MRASSPVRSRIVWSACATLLLVNGCLAGVERGVDLLLAPDALQNTLRLPFSALFPLARILSPFV